MKMKGEKRHCNHLGLAIINARRLAVLGHFRAILEMCGSSEEAVHKSEPEACHPLHPIRLWRLPKKQPPEAV